MKRHLLAFILAAFAGTVVYLLSYSLGVAFSRFFLNPVFMDFKTQLLLKDFIAGADIFFCILLFFIYALSSGIFYSFYNDSIKSIQIKQIILGVISIVIVELTVEYRDIITIVTEFNRVNYIFFLVGIGYYLKNITEVKDGIDKVFDSFIPAIIIGFSLFFILWAFSGFQFHMISMIKLIFLLGFAAFVHLLSCYTLFSSFYKIEEV